MTKQEHDTLTAILNGNAWEIRPKLDAFMKTAQIAEEPKGQRTGAQNRALHLYFEHVAETLNAAGLDMRTVIKEEVDIPWTAENVKEYLWRPVQKLAVQVESTRDLNKHQVSQVWEIFNRHIAKHGVHVPFPSDEFNMRIQAVDNLSRSDYPEHTPTAFD